MKVEEKTSVISFPLRLPQSLKAAAKFLADSNGLSLNRFISEAVAEKIDRLEQERSRERPDE
jgi:predicted HicB family RNase H-like nuclease